MRTIVALLIASTLGACNHTNPMHPFADYCEIRGRAENWTKDDYTMCRMVQAVTNSREPTINVRIVR